MMSKCHTCRVEPNLKNYGWQQAFGLKFLDDENNMETNGKLDLNDGL